MAELEHESKPGKRQGFTRRTKVILWIFVLVFVGVGITVGEKLYEWFQDLTDTAGIHFAGPHLITYFLLALGFLLLLGFAFFSGHFSNIEQPKYDMLEQEKEYDRREFHTP